MHRAFRITAALGAVLFALVGLAACGGIPGDAVVSVDGKSITKDTYTHWLNVEGKQNGAKRRGDSESSVHDAGTLAETRQVVRHELLKGC